MNRLLWLLLIGVCAAQTTPNIGLNIPTPGTQVNNWGGLINNNFTNLDLYLSGGLGAPGVYASLLNNVAHVGSLGLYAPSSVGINNAIAAVCNGTIPGKVILDTVVGGVVAPATAALTPRSNCKIEGPGAALFTLQATPSYNSGTMVPIGGVTNFTMQGFTIDAGSPSNLNSFSIVQISGGSSAIEIDHMVLANSNATGINGNGASSNVTISNTECKNNGSPLSVGPFGGCIGISPGANNVSDWSIGPNDYIHGNNIGVFATNPSSPSNTITGLAIFNSRLEGNAGDAIDLTFTNTLGGMIIGPRVVNNWVRCNGFSVSGFPTACTPDHLQNGNTNSSNGVGIDMIGPFIVAPIISNDHSEYNIFDGISIALEQFNAVTVAGTVNVTCTDCGITAPVFNVNWQPNEFISINNHACLIQSVTDTSHLVIVSNGCGANNGQMLSPSYGGGAIIGNTLSYNLGTGIFLQGSDAMTVTGNTEDHNAIQGLGLSFSNFVTIGNNVGISNDTANLGGANGAITLNNTSFTQISNPVNVDPTASPKQVNGVLASGTFNLAVTGCPTAQGGLPVNDASSSVGTSFNNCGKPLGILSLSGQTANVSSGNTLYTVLSSPFGWGGTGLYRVCASLWPTGTGNSTVQANALATIGASTVVSPIGSSLNTAATTNGGGGCAVIRVDAGSAIKVNTTGYNTTGTYSLQATAEWVPTL